jgi:hypothetical protein
MKQNDALKQPFFAKMLESQNTNPEPQEQSRLPIGKYPPADDPVTMKYPSDGDDDYPKL